MISVKNFDLNEKGPEKFAPGSNNKVWWICKDNTLHKYMERISHRTRSNPTGCPFWWKAKGENIVGSLLAKRNIILKSQYIHPY